MLLKTFYSNTKLLGAIFIATQLNALPCVSWLQNTSIIKTKALYLVTYVKQTSVTLAAKTALPYSYLAVNGCVLP